MKTKIYNLIIIDESGSMQIIKQEAINNVNETIQTIRSAQAKHLDQEHFVTLVTFNDEVKVIHDCAPVEKIAELTSETYIPNCNTALFDAMGRSLNQLRKQVTDDDKVLVTVITDGYENASREYRGAAIKALIDELKAKDWIFAYIGANQDVEAIAKSMSIDNILAFHPDACGVKKMTARMNRSRKNLFDNIGGWSGFASKFVCDDDDDNI